MRILSICLIIIGLFLSSCEKSNNVDHLSKTTKSNLNYLEKIERPTSFRSSNYEQIISFSGNSIYSNKTISGNFKIVELENGGLGDVYIDGNFAQKAFIELENDYINDIEINRTSNNSYIYTKVFEGQSVIVNNVLEDDNSIQGQLVTESGTIDFIVDVNKTDASRAPIPLIIWAVAGAISVLTTTISCTVMRATAQSGCEDSYQQCLTTCPSQQCSYNYIGGACGGSCHVDCKQ